MSDKSQSWYDDYMAAGSVASHQKISIAIATYLEGVNCFSHKVD